MTKYEYYYKREIDVNNGNIDWRQQDYWDIFISSYNLSDRLINVFEDVKATSKYWFVSNEYHFDDQELPDEYISLTGIDESDKVHSLMAEIRKHHSNLNQSSICIDATGFIRPQLAFLLKYLKAMGISSVDIVYSKPQRYRLKEKTPFSLIPNQTRPVHGYEGHHSTDTSNDILIIGAGYDVQLIKQVSTDKESCRKIFVVGFPSLQPDMYQENVLRINEVEAGLSFNPQQNDPIVYFAPAYDPFITASCIQEIVQTENKRKPITNLYLAPLATKPQLIGFVVYFLLEKYDAPTSLIFPFAERYEKKTSENLSGLWIYHVELG